ncbi:hypothetical protein GGH94_001269 [Coemansia aciculifera]|uniref:RRM domain-containing protein n=1 Tax=Coemansia aciculifera TaxID=417176 RepID=A0A9W8M6J3_9FUNG|nr:hypothetical protein GGH94_001269 [Coemansia aciculifera]
MSTITETKPTIVDQFPSKVFVGNLSFKTTDGQLKDFFSDVGDVKEARIITRGPRSLGYGFVAFADDATVNKAVEMKNQAELEGRKINVESARPMTEGALEARPAKPSTRRRRAPAKDRSKARIDAPQDGSDSSQKQVKVEASEDVKPSVRRQQQPRKSPRKVEQPIIKEERTPSETVVFVGNLPFSTTDEELCNLFSGFSISSAHVVVGQKNSRPKGFGFVTFASHEDQTKAVEKFVNEPLTVNDRVLNIKAAFSESPSADSAVEADTV